MKGFPQWIFCPCVIYRVGPEAGKFHDKWRYAVVVTFPWGQILRWILRKPAVAMIWALSADGEFGPIYAGPILRWVRSVGFKPDWDDSVRHKKEDGDAVDPAERT